MTTTPLWKQLIHQDKLDRQYAVLLTNKDATHYEIAIRLARFAEANIFEPADDAVDAAHKVVATVRAEMLTLQRQLTQRDAWEPVPDGTYLGADAQMMDTVVDRGVVRNILHGNIAGFVSLHKGWRLFRRVTSAPTPGQEKTGDELRRMVFGTEDSEAGA